MFSKKLLASGRALILMFCLGISSFLAAQTDIVWINGTVLKLCDAPDLFAPNPPPPSPCPLTTIQATMTECDDGYVTIAAYCVNLFGTETPDPNVDYLWPTITPNNEYLPDLHLQYEYSPGLFKVSDKIEIWNYVQTIDMGPDIELHVFEGQMDLTPQFLENLDCRYHPDIVTFDMDVRLVTPTYLGSKNFIDYPVALFGESDDIFSCLIFDETNSMCGPDPHVVATTYPMEICSDCSDCGFVPDNPKKRIGAEIEKTQLVVMENPFNSSINFQYSVPNDGRIKLSLLNSNGQRVLTQSHMVIRGQNDFTIPVENFSNGLYYLEIQNNDQTDRAALIKID